jgi:hypothetical protein
MTWPLGTNTQARLLLPARQGFGSTFAIDGDRVIVHWVFDIGPADGKAYARHELADQTWRGDRIASGREDTPIGGTPVATPLTPPYAHTPAHCRSRRNT